MDKASLALDTSRLTSLLIQFSLTFMSSLTTRKYPFWIKERHNPQIGVYYVPMGQMSKTAAKRCESPLYGVNIMIRVDNETDYLAKLKELGAKS